MSFILLLNIKNMELLLRRYCCHQISNTVVWLRLFTSFILLWFGSGLCLWGCCYSLGCSQVQFITKSKAGDALETEETPPGDGKEDAY